MTSPTSEWEAGTRDTLLRALARAVSACPDSVFLDFSGQTCTYREFDRLTNRMAHGLSEDGVVSGQTVATMLDNSIDAMVCWFSVNKLGAIWVPVNTAFQGDFLRHPLNDCGARIVVCDAAYVAPVVGLAGTLDNVELVLVRGPVSEIAESRVEVAAFDTRRGDDESAIEGSYEPTDIAALIYTSGTTGPSKACMMSHNYLCHIARCGSALVDLAPDEVVWTPLPLFHTSGIQAVIGALVMGGRVSVSVRFSVSRFWQQIEESGASVAKIMASMVPLLAEAPDSDVMKRCHGQLRAVVGNPFTPEYKRIFAERFGVRYIASNQYASTEGYCVTSVPYGSQAPPNSAGKLNADYDVILVDGADREVPAGEPGEVVYRPRRPDIMFAGYWGQPEKTAQAWRNLWMHTGDIGRFDEAGFLYFVERKKDYIRRRGENVSSWEVEQALIAHPAISEVAVHAVPSELGEDDIRVVAVRGSDVDESELWKWCFERLPSFAVPRYVEFRAELPKNGVGRVLKYKLREEELTSATWDVTSADLATNYR